MEGDGGEDTPQGRMDSMYQIVGYRIMGGDVEESRDSLPVLPQQRQEGGAQYYLAAIPLYRFAGEGVSYYGAVNKRADIAVEIRDVLGNRGEFACERVTGTYNSSFWKLHLTLTLIPSQLSCHSITESISALFAAGFSSLRNSPLITSSGEASPDITA